MGNYVKNKTKKLFFPNVIYINIWLKVYDNNYLDYVYSENGNIVTTHCYHKHRR